MRKGGLSMKLRSTHAVSSLAWLSLVFVGCQESYHEKEEHYVLIAANINLPYSQEAEAGLRDVAQEMGLRVKADIDGPTSFNPKDEIDAFPKAVASHPAGTLP